MGSPVINPNKTPDFGAMTIAELREEALRLAGVLTLCNDQRKAIHAEVDRRQARVKMQQRVAGMTEVDKDALRTVLDGP